VVTFSYAPVQAPAGCADGAMPWVAAVSIRAAFPLKYKDRANDFIVSLAVAGITTQ
jgi:hypothetical protein